MNLKKLALVIFTSFLVLTFSYSVNATYIDDIVGYYTMDDADTFATNLYDLSGNGNNLTLIASPGTGRLGILNEAYELFSSGTPEQLESSSGTTWNVDTNENITVSIWIETNTSGRIQNILTNRPTSTKYYQMRTRSTGEINIIFRNDAEVGTMCQFYGNTNVANSGLTHVVWLRNGTNCAGDNHIWVDGVKESITTNLDNDVLTVTGGSTLDVGVYDDGASEGADSFDGIIDELLISIGNGITDTEVSTLYNSGNGYNPLDAGDTTGPSITNVVQTPTNLTTLNVVDSYLSINATITDVSGVNLSTVILNFTAEHVEIYWGGVLQDLQNNLIAYNLKDADNFHWELDEEYYLSQTSPLHHDEFVLNPILNDTLDSANQWIKAEFWNVSNAADLMFTEIMDSNTSGIAEYYYCNSNYTTGNPTTSELCTKFFTQTDNDLIHEHSSNTWHRLMPMNINTINGTLNDVYVTETSYILKRGSSDVERYYYIQNDTGTAERSNNNGNSWSSQTYTINAQIHQMHEGENITYEICAYDNSSNRACDGPYTDMIDFPNLPPVPVKIDSPVYNATYNGTVYIDHTTSISLTGATITGYLYRYRRNGTSTWTTLVENNYPTQDYNWDITNRQNGYYQLEVVVTDSNNLTAVTETEFWIDNEESLNTQLLTEISEKLNYLENIYEELQNMTLISIFIAFNVLVFWIINKNIYSITKMVLYFISLGIDLMAISVLRDQYFNSAVGTGISAVFMAIGTFIVFASLPLFKLWLVIKQATVHVE